MKLSWYCDLDNPKDLSQLLKLEEQYDEFKKEKCKCLDKEDCICMSFNNFCHKQFNEVPAWM